jgi:hypothetical protein
MATVSLSMLFVDSTRPVFGKNPKMSREECEILKELQQENAALRTKVEEIQSANAVFLASFQSLSADRQELLRYKASGGKKACAFEVVPVTAPLLSAPAIRSHQASRSTVPPLKLQALEPSFSFESKSTPRTLTSLQSVRSGTSSNSSLPWGHGILPSPRLELQSGPCLPSSTLYDDRWASPLRYQGLTAGSPARRGSYRGGLAHLSSYRGCHLSSDPHPNRRDGFEGSVTCSESNYQGQGIVCGSTVSC